MVVQKSFKTVQITDYDDGEREFHNYTELTTNTICLNQFTLHLILMNINYIP